MRLLILGGTSFVGRAIAEDALAQGFAVTLFGRGQTGPELFPGVPRRRGDRDHGDYASLADQRWDAVVDVSGYVPRQVGQAMDALGDRVGRYLFVSSNAVYATHVGDGADEDAPRKAARRDTEDLDQDSYGPLKVACEDDVTARFGAWATVVRPGKVAGPHDPQDGLTYWVRRAARGGRVAVPGSLEQPVQLVDARDLARLVTRLLAADRGGAFHAVGEGTTLGALVRCCADVAGAAVELVPVPLAAVPPFFPLVRAPDAWSTQTRDPARARAAGLSVTPLAQTVADVLAWDRARGEPPLNGGLTPAAEAEVLAQLT